MRNVDESMDWSREQLDHVIFERLFGADHGDRRHHPTRDIGRVNVLPSLHCILQLTALIAIVHTNFRLIIQKCIY